MAALDLSTYVSQDTAELIEFKAKVKRVAKKYADRHGWCSEVDRALMEMGIDDGRTVDIKVTTTFGFEFTLTTEPEKLVGLDEDKQKKKACDLLGAIRLSGGHGKASGTLNLTPEQIADMSIASPEIGRGGWFYTSADGRVMHHFTGQLVRTTVYADCGVSSNLVLLTITAPRGSGTHCKRCEGRRVDTVLAA